MSILYVFWTQGLIHVRQLLSNIKSHTYRLVGGLWPLIVFSCFCAPMVDGSDCDTLTHRASYLFAGSVCCLFPRCLSKLSNFHLLNFHHSSGVQFYYTAPSFAVTWYLITLSSFLSNVRLFEASIFWVSQSNPILLNYFRWI